MKTSRILVAILALVILQASTILNTFAEDKKPIRIGTSIGLTGIYAELGHMFQLSYQLWEAQVNQRGGILGRPVQIIIRDDQSSVDEAKKIYNDFITNEKIDFVIGPYSSQITAAVIPITEKYSYPTLAPGAASDELWAAGYKYLFGISSPASRRVIGFFALLSEENIDRVAIVGVDDPFSVSNTEGAKRWASEYKMTIVYSATLPKKKPDLDTALRAARQAGAQALVITGHFEEAVAARRILKKIGWTPKAYYASNGPSLPKYRETLGADAQGAYTTSLWEPREDLKLPGSVEFLKEFRTRYNKIPSYHATLAYAACQVLEEAIKKVGTIERAAVRQALTSLDINTIIGRHAVDRTGLQVKQFPLIVQLQGDKSEIIWPVELRTAKPIFNK